MKREINNFILIWTVAVITMCYCHKIGKLIPKGKARLLAISPAIIILLLLPLRITFIIFGGPIAFFLGWLSTFKLLLFAFGNGPLSSDPPLSLSHFVSLACLPIKFQHKPIPSNTPNNQNTKKDHKLTINNVCAILVFGLTSLSPFYIKKENMHLKFIMFLYSIYMYIGLYFIFVLVSLFSRKLLQVELEPQFDKPYISTSLQDFWGRRWNLMVNRILHPAVYNPVMSYSASVIGRRWAPLPAILATFLVSGLMHELIFYYIKRGRTLEAWEPSWGSMCFFLLHGVCVSIEVSLKKILGGKLQLSRFISWLLTVIFILYTTLSLFLPAVVRCGVYDKAAKEMNDLVEFGKDLCGVVGLRVFM